MGKPLAVTLAIAAVAGACAIPGHADPVPALEEITDVVGSGAFKQITSVIVARDDRILYEHYFDAGGADELRNTRSVTKTLTGMPIGVAVDRGLLRADTRVMPYFKDPLPVANPDARNGRQVISADWVRRSMSPHAKARENTDYGYLWWLETFDANGRRVRTYGMYGTGGNKVFVLPDQKAVVVITSRNYKVPGSSALTDKLFLTQIVPALVGP